MSVLEVKNISFSYDGKRKILEDVNLSLEDGELVCVLGTSGGGKTTLFQVIAGLNRPESGQILLNGEDVTGETGHVSYMLQKDHLLPYYTIEDNISLPLRIRGMKKQEARKKACALLPQFGLEGVEKQYPSQLSGGMRQRAALLRTYMFSGKAALLDEPFSALDALTKADMRRWYLGVMEKIRLSTLFITHDIDEAILLSDRVCILGGNPANIRGEIAIDEPRPRGEEFSLSERFLKYKRKISDMLK